MTGHQIAYVRCEGDRCDQRAPIDGGCVTVADARRFAERRGWAVQGRDSNADICPHCLDD